MAKPSRLRLVVFLLLADASAAQTPAKLNVDTSQRALTVGQTINLRVALLDAAGRRTLAPKPLTVAIQMRMTSGTVESLGTVTISTGQDGANFSKPLPEAGLLYIWAKNAELIPGGQYVNVRPKFRPILRDMDVVRPKAVPPEVVGGVLQPKSLPPPPPPPVQAPNPSAAVPEVTLRYSPQRDFLANGADPAEVEAFLVGDVVAAPTAIRLTLFDSTGSLRPTPLTIPAGQPVGHSTITSNAPGPVSVEYLSSNPHVAFIGDKTLSVKFVTPISQLIVRASPPAISLVDTSDIVVSLAGADGRILVTGSPRPVSLSLTSGRGHIAQQDLAIPAGSFDARVHFTPEWPGLVTVSAASPNLLTVEAPLNVSWPIALLLSSALGAAAGGFVSRQTRKRADKWRVPTGLVTGFLFYWACIFLGLGRLLGTSVLNPLSAFAVSAVGGWLQTEVFTLVADLLRPKPSSN
jgi:hypothetical protein